MSTEIRVPTLGESVTEAEVIQWFKQAGDSVAVDEPLVELETDKVTIELPSPAAGVLAEITVNTGETVEVDALLGMIGDGDGAVVKAKPAAAKEEVKAEPAPKAEPTPAAAEALAVEASGGDDQALSPAVKKLIDENGLDASTISGSGKDGRIVKGDVLAVLDAKGAAAPAAAPAAPIAVPAAAKPASAPSADQGDRKSVV